MRGCVVCDRHARNQSWPVLRRHLASQHRLAGGRAQMLIQTVSRGHLVVLSLGPDREILGWQLEFR